MAHRMSLGSTAFLPLARGAGMVNYAITLAWHSKRARRSVAGQRRRQNFDGHVAVEPGVEGLADLSHAALADQRLNLEVPELFAGVRSM